MTLNVLKISESDMYKRFENICKELFMKKYKISESKSFFNQQAIETLPVLFENVNYAFQCKYVDNVSSKLVKEFLKGIDYLVSKREVIPVNHITYYLGFTPGESKNGVFPEFETKVNEYASANSISVKWVYSNEIEEQLELVENRGIFLKYIEPINRQYLLKDYQGHIASSDLDYFINRKVAWKYSNLDLFELIKQEKIIYLLSEAGVGKTTQVKWLINCANKEEWHTKLVKLKAYTGQELSFYFNSSFFSSKFQLVVFDGFDEINSIYIDKFNILVDSIHNVQTSTRIVVTSRKNYFSYVNPFSTSNIAILEPICNSDIMEYIRCRIGINNELYSLVIENKHPDYFSVPFFLKNTVDLFILGHFKTKISEVLSELFKLCLSTVDLSIRELIRSQLEEIALKFINHDLNSLPIENVEKLNQYEVLRFPWIENDPFSQHISFKHNSYKEFLVALYLTRMDKEEMLQKISIQILDENYILPKYSNILPYIIDLSNDFDDYLKLLLEKGIANVFHFELKFLNDKQKLACFERLISKSLSRKTWFDTKQVNYKDLSVLINSKLGINYLLKKMSQSTHRTEFNLYLNVVNELPKSIKSSNFLLRDAVFLIAIEKHQDGSFTNRVAINALKEFPLSIENVTDIIKSNISDEDSSVRYAIYDLVKTKKLTNELILLIFRLTGFYNDEGRSYLGYRDITEGIYFKKVIESLSNIEVIIKVCEILIEKHHDSYSNDFMNSILKSISNLDETLMNDELLSHVYNIIIRHKSDHYAISNEHVQKVLSIGNNRTRIYKLALLNLKTYEDVNALSYIVDLGLFNQIIGIMEYKSEISKYKQYFINAINHNRQDKELIDAIKPFLVVEQKHVEGDKNSQVLFNNLFLDDYLKNTILEIFEYYKKDCFTFDELMLDYKINIDHDIKLLFHSESHVLFNKDTVLSWDFMNLTDNLILQKLANHEIIIQPEMISRVNSIIQKLTLPDLGMIEQTITSSSIDMKLWIAGYLLYKYEVKHHDEDLIAKLLTIDIYDRSSNEEIKLSFYEQFIDHEVILKLTKDLINKGYFKNRHSLAMRVEYLTKYSYQGAENFLYNLLLDMTIRAELYDLKKSILQYLDSINKINICVEKMYELDEETYEYLLEIIDDSDYSTDFVPLLLPQLEDTSLHRVALTYKTLFAITPEMYEESFIEWVKGINKEILKNDSTYLELISRIVKLDTLLFILDKELEIYNQDEDNQRIHVVTNKISSYFMIIDNKEIFETKIKKYISLLENSKHYISSFFFTYIDNIILEYLKRL